MSTRRLLPLAILASAWFAGALGSGVARAEGAQAAAIADRLTTVIESSFQAGDARKIGQLFTKNAVAMPAGYDTVEGREAIENFYRDFFKQYQTVIAITPVETTLFGDRGIARGTYVLKLVPRDGSPAATDRGKYIYLMQRQADGTWRITHDMSNSSPQ